MGRKHGKRGPKQASVPHKEAFQRMNYLYQAALAAVSATPSQPQLARFYIHSMKMIGKRLVLRMDPSVKRSLCKSCDTLLVPGVTCTQRLRAHRQKHVVVTCLTCGAVKRFLTQEKHQLWSERPENIVPPPPAVAGARLCLLEDMYQDGSPAVLHQAHNHWQKVKMEMLLVL